MGPYTLTYLRAETLTEPHRSAVVARIAVSRGGQDIAVMGPRMNQYESQREPIGTPDVKSFLFHDLYLSVMNISPDGQNLGLLALVNPMVGWIWGATGLMALGGFLTLVPQRRVAAATAAEPGR